jgi:RNA ligase
MNLETLHKYKEDGLLRCQTHPTLPLTIWNYTEKVQYEGLWDDITLSCRGLVTDENGIVVARPFKKFFNMEEGKHTPTEDFEVYEKMDGSLGILFYYKGEWVYATRGSFTSEQAIHFKRIMESKYSKDLDYALYPDSTYLFEIIYPENRIVVDYGEEERLVLLGEIQTDIGDEMNIDVYYNTSSLDIVKRYDGIKDVNQLKETIGDNREGYIIRFSNGDRMKIKGEEYLRLHKIMTEVSTTGIWESLKNGDDIADLLKDVPDEFYDKIDEYAEELVVTYQVIESEYNWIFNKLRGIEDRARFAELAKKFKYPQLLFKMLDGSDYTEALWRIIKPEWRKL